MSLEAAGSLPRISVVIPYWRGERHIGDCLASVQAQTLRPVEVIVVDDASDSDGFLRRFEPWIRIITLARNSGPGPSRNAGIEAASGEYIAFIDHDDLWEPGKLAYQADYLQSHPECAGTHTGMVAFFADGSQKVYVVKPATLSLSDTLTGSHVLPTSLMIRRAVLREVGGFGTWSRSCEDDELMIRVVAAGHRIDFQPAPLARLRRFQHGNLSSNWSQVLRARLRIAWYHRRLYRRALGPGAVRRTVSKHCWHVGNGSAPRWAGFPLRAVALLLGYRRVAESDSKGLPP